MIDATVLFLTVSDCRDNPVVKKHNIDARVNHDFETSTIGPLKKVFSRLIEYDYLKKYVEIGVKRTNKEIIDIVQKEHPEYVLWPSMTYELLESTFDKIRQRGSKVIGWFFDDEVRFDEYSKWWIPHLYYILTTDAESVEKYTNLGAKALHFPVFSNPDVFRRLNLPEKYDLSFAGTKIADREELVNNLRAQGFSVEAFGRGWDSGYISLDQMIEIYNISRINLCFMKSYGVNTRPQMKCKIFDVCMCGGFLLCEYIPGIEEFYEIDKEIVCFRDIEEATDKIKYYLSHENEREAITKAGYERAQRDHTTAKRLSEAFQEIEKETRNGTYHSQYFPELVEMPQQIRKLPSTYHLNWAIALLLENYKELWQDELDLALAYDPSNIVARYLYTVGRFPPMVCTLLIRGYQVLLTLSRPLPIFCRVLYSIFSKALVRMLLLPLELRLRFNGHSPIFKIFTSMTLQEKLLLYKIARGLKPASTIVEIGSYLGASSSFLAVGAQESRSIVYCVDTWQNDAMSEGRRVTFNEFIENTRRFGKVITPLRGFSNEMAKNFNKKIDLLFVDGDHSYEGVKGDVESWFPRLNYKAIVAFHDIQWAEGVQRVVKERVRPLAKKEILLPNLYLTFIDNRNEEGGML